MYYINFFYPRKLTSQIKNDLNTHLYIYISEEENYILYEYIPCTMRSFINQHLLLS